MRSASTGVSSSPQNASRHATISIRRPYLTRMAPAAVPASSASSPCPASLVTVVLAQLRVPRNRVRFNLEADVSAEDS